LAHRAGLAAEHGAPETTYAALFYVMLFVDDAAGGTIDDPLYDHRGQPILAEKDGKLAHVGRADMYLDACLKILEYFGHGESVGKTVSPSLERDFLGVTESLATRLLFLAMHRESQKGALPPESHWSLSLSELHSWVMAVAVPIE
jgi:hypothetical protein